MAAAGYSFDNSSQYMDIQMNGVPSSRGNNHVDHAPPPVPTRTHTTAR